MKNVYIVGGGSDYARMFVKLGFTVVDQLETADLVCFTGGEDVSPIMYGDAPHRTTYNNYARDSYEAEVFNILKDSGAPMVGICRGAQFLNVMSGGRMYQHVGSHTRPHYITDLESGEVVYVSSTHHQMMMPSPEGLLVASSALGGSREWFDADVARKDVSKEDIEVVYYEHTRCLCFQPHPEHTSDHWPVSFEPMTQYFGKLLTKYLGV